MYLKAFGIIGTRSLKDSAEERELKLEGYQVLVPTVAGVGVGLKQDVLKAAQTRLSCLSTHCSHNISRAAYTVAYGKH